MTQDVAWAEMTERSVPVRMTSLPFVLLASLTLPSAAGQPAPAATPPQSAFPMQGTKEGVETIKLITVYRIPKWDDGEQGGASLTPPAGAELIVVRFDREPAAGKTLARNHLTLVDHGGNKADPAPSNIYREAVSATVPGPRTPSS